MKLKKGICLILILMYSILTSISVFAFGKIEEASFNYPIKTHYLSPINQDGINDIIDLALVENIEAAKRAKLQKVFLNVYDVSGQKVLMRGGDIATTTEFVFDGKNDAGDFLPDGFYVFTIVVQEKNGNLSTSQPYPVVIDNTPPEISHSRIAAGNLVSFNSSISIELNVRTSKEEEWKYVVVGNNGFEKVIFSQKSDMPKAAPESFIWNGTDEFNNLIPDGKYSIRIDGMDKAGNVNKVIVFPQVIVNHEGVVSIFAKDGTVFSPNNDGVQDKLSIGIVVPEAHTIGHSSSFYNWRFVLYKGEEVVYRESFEYNDVVEFTGIDKSGIAVADGAYKLFVEYTSSKIELQTNGIDIEIDTVRPNAAVLMQTSPSPIKDGEPFYFGSQDKQKIDVEFKALEELKWFLKISQKNGDTLETLNDTPVTLDDDKKFSFVIDKQFSADGQQLMDGFYSMSFYAIDKAGNRGGVENVNFIRDFSEKKLEVTKDTEEFSLSSGVPINFSIDYTLVGLKDFRFVIQDTSGRKIRELYREQQGVYNFEWNGYTDNDTPALDGEYEYIVTTRYLNGTELTKNGFVRVDSSPPVINEFKVKDTTINPRDVTHNNNKLEVIQSSESKQVMWEATIFNIFEQEIYKKQMPDQLQNIVWDGKDAQGNIVPDGDYIYLLSGRDLAGNSVTRDASFIVDSGSYNAGKKLDPNNDMPMIFFHGFSNDLFSYGGDDLLYENLLNIRSMAKLLKSNPSYKVRIIGHAAALLTGSRASTEQFEVLVPLSRERAEQIRRALIILGIDDSRISTKAIGGAEPLVDNPNKNNIWQNRRVEFELYQ